MIVAITETINLDDPDSDASGERINGTSRTPLPGLIDAHTHARPPALELALTFGVTTELDMFSDPAWMTEQRAQPRVPHNSAGLEPVLAR